MRKILTEKMYSIRELILNKDFPSALIELEKINIEELSQEEYAYYCLLLAEAKLWMGDYDTRDLLNKTIQYYRKSTKHDLYAHAKYLYGRYLISVGRHFEAREILLESYLYFQRYDNIDAVQRVLNYLAQVQFQTGAIIFITVSLLILAQIMVHTLI